MGCSGSKKRTPDEVVTTVSDALGTKGSQRNLDELTRSDSVIFKASQSAFEQTRASESGTNGKSSGGGKCAVKSENYLSAAMGEALKNTSAKGSGSGRVSSGGSSGNLTPTALAVGDALTKSSTTVSGSQSFPACSKKPSAFAEPPFSAEEQMARRAALKAASADLLKQMGDSEGVKANKSEVTELLGYGPVMAREAVAFVAAARQLDEGKAGKPPPSPGKSNSKLNAAEAQRQAQTLLQHEQKRSGQCQALEHRLQMGASSTKEDVLVAARDYAALCSMVVDSLMQEIPFLPQTTAGAVSAYLSAVSHHRNLALKALGAEDDGSLLAASKREEAAKRAGLLGRQQVLAEAREAKESRAQLFN